MHLLIAYCLLVQQELQSKRCFDILLTTMEIMMETDSNSDYSSNSNSSSIIDLTAGNDTTSVAEFVNFPKTPEVVDLCSSSSGSSNSSASLLYSKLLLCSLLQEGQSDSDISTSGTSLCSSRTGGRAGLPHLQLIGTLVKFCPDESQGQGDNWLQGQGEDQLKEEEPRVLVVGSVPFFLHGEHCLQKRPLHLEHPDCFPWRWRRHLFCQSILPSTQPNAGI